MTASNSFPASGSMLSMDRNAARSFTSYSFTIVQNRSPLTSVRIRIRPMPWRSMSFAIARNFSFNGFTWPGLQWYTSRMRSMRASRYRMVGWQVEMVLFQGCRCTDTDGVPRVTSQLQRIDHSGFDHMTGLPSETHRSSAASPARSSLLCRPPAGLPDFLTRDSTVCHGSTQRDTEKEAQGLRRIWGER